MAAAPTLVMSPRRARSGSTSSPPTRAAGSSRTSQPADFERPRGRRRRNRSTRRGSSGRPSRTPADPLDRRSTPTRTSAPRPRGPIPGCWRCFSTSTTSAPRTPRGCVRRSSRFVDEYLAPRGPRRRHAAARFALRDSPDARPGAEPRRRSATFERPPGRLHAAQRLRAQLHRRHAGAHRAAPGAGHDVGAQRAGGARRQPQQRRAQDADHRQRRAAAGDRRRGLEALPTIETRDPVGQPLERVGLCRRSARVAGRRRRAAAGPRRCPARRWRRPPTASRS